MEEVWFREQERDNYILMAILNALEVKLVRDIDTEELAEVENFSWRLLSFTEDYIILKINFENPQNLGSFDSKDFIQVKFWGIEYFKSVTGIEVEFGKTVTYPIMRQVSTEEAESLQQVEETMNGLMVTAFVPFLMLVGFGGRLLPTWMFLNSMQLIVHTPLLQTFMPSNLNLFFVDYLNLVRLNSEQIGEQIDAWQKDRGQADYELAQGEESSYSALLNQCGYKHAFARNLVVVIAIAMALLLVMVVLLLFDGIRKCRGQGQGRRRPRVSYMAWMGNFSLRFVYEFFLEICLSVLIHMSAMGASEGQSTLLHVLVILILLGIVALTVFIAALFFKWGPYVEPCVYE